jgi:hypothetical protein
MRTLLYAIPTFTAALLACASHEVSTPILSIFCDMVCKHLDPLNAKSPRDEYDTLAKEGLLFLEGLIFTTLEEQAPLYDLSIYVLLSLINVISRLSTIIRNSKVLSILLDPSQPTWLIARATRALAVSASSEHI